MDRRRLKTYIVLHRESQSSALITAARLRFWFVTFLPNLLLHLRPLKPYMKDAFFLKIHFVKTGSVVRYFTYWILRKVPLSWMRFIVTYRQSNSLWRLRELVTVLRIKNFEKSPSSWKMWNLNYNFKHVNFPNALFPILGHQSSYASTFVWCREGYFLNRDNE